MVFGLHSVHDVQRKLIMAPSVRREYPARLTPPCALGALTHCCVWLTVAAGCGEGGSPTLSDAQECGLEGLRRWPCRCRCHVHQCWHTHVRCAPRLPTDSHSSTIAASAAMRCRLSAWNACIPDCNALAYCNSRRRGSAACGSCHLLTLPWALAGGCGRL